MATRELNRVASLHHTPDNWQAQVEELVALQAILPSEFRVIHVPGLGTRPHAHGEHNTSLGEAPPATAEAAAAPPPQLEDLLELDPPQDNGLIVCQLTAALDPLEAPLQLVVSLPQQPAGEGVASAAPSSSRAQRQAQPATSAPSSSSSSKQLAAVGGPGSASKQQVLVPIGEPVRFLTPITLHLVFPVTYPSEEPPEVGVSSSWLSPGQQRQLSAALLETWQEEGPGSPVCYQWLEWLRSNALTCLGISTTLVVPVQPEGGAQSEATPRNTPTPEAERGSSSSRSARSSPQQQQPQTSAAAAHSRPAGQASPAQQQQQQQEQRQEQQQQVVAAHMAAAEQVALQLLVYNREQEQAEFEAASWPCSVCFEDVRGSRCCRVTPCSHVFCKSCLAGYCTSLVGEGQVQQLRCPEPSCRGTLHPSQVKELLTPELFARWEALLLSRTLDAMQDLVYCPRCEAACLQDKDNCAQCPACLYAFCALCGDSWHPGNPCLDDEQKTLVLARRQQRQGVSDARKEADLVNQILSLRLLANTSRKCPGCYMPTEKIAGCNKMTCSFCEQIWCWACGAAISGYEHFSEGRCVIFEEAVIQEWNRQMENPAAVVAEARLMLPGARRCRCPVCGQQNAKVGRNNLVRCWACSQHFCYGCGSWLRNKVGAHFAQGGCKQHSDD